MADILIRGMEMPKNCRSCPFKSETYWRGTEICLANNRKEIEISLATGCDINCPLVVVQNSKGGIEQVTGEFICDEGCRFYPPSSLGGKPCCVCDPSNTYLNCYSEREAVSQNDTE